MLGVFLKGFAGLIPYQTMAMAIGRTRMMGKARSAHCLERLECRNEPEAERAKFCQDVPGGRFAGRPICGSKLLPRSLMAGSFRGRRNPGESRLVQVPLLRLKAVDVL